MNTAVIEPTVDERLRRVLVTDSHVIFHLEDGRIVYMPLSWSWRLQEASDEERQQYEVHEQGAYWPDLDEDLSVRGALRGEPARKPGSRAEERPAAAWGPGEIKQLRRQMGLTQQAFAEKLGVRQATVSDWENHRQVPSSMAARLLDMFRRRHMR